MTKISEQTTLTVGFTTLHTVDSHRWLTVSVVHVANVTAGAVTVQLCYVPPGGAAAVGNAALWNYSIPANDFIEFGEGDILFPNWTIQGLASAGNSINVRIAGEESV